MVTCVCIRDCYITPKGHKTSSYFERGDVRQFEEVPNHFIPVDGSVVAQKTEENLPKAAVDSGVVEQSGQFSFATAGEEVLLAAEYDLQQLKDFGSINYGAVFNETDDKTVVVAKFVDARYRSVTAKSAINAANVSILK
jgi:hypothetical protein